MVDNLPSQICGAYVVSVFAKRIPETINLFQPRFVREVFHAFAAILGHRSRYARFSSHGGNSSSAEGAVT
jgi:hypothetical protein